MWEGECGYVTVRVCDSQGVLQCGRGNVSVGRCT